MRKLNFWLLSSLILICLVIVSWLLGFGIGGCGHPVQQGGPNIPNIIAVSPADKSTGIDLTILVSATFDKDMDASTINAASFTLSSAEGSVTGVVTYEAASKQATFSPASPLALATKYSATIAGTVKESGGETMGSSYSWSFTTGSYFDARGITDESFSDGTNIGYGVYRMSKQELGITRYGATVGRSMVMDANGRILVAGSGTASAGSGTSMRIWRILPDGSLDGSFGEAGVVEYFYASSEVDNEFVGRSIMLDAAGKILVTGEQWLASSEGLAVWRYNADGTTDESFGRGGKTSYKFVFYGYSLALDASGNIFVLGDVQGFEGGGLPLGYRIVQFKPDGTFDKTIPADATPEGVVFRDETRTTAPSGKVVVTGTGSLGWYLRDMVTRRFNADGTTDESFGVSGIVTFTNPTVGEDVLGKSVCIDMFGRVVVMGGILSSGSFLTSGIEAMTIWRYK